MIINSCLKMVLPLFFLFLRLSAQIGANQDECKVPSCSPHGPAIKFPFRRKDQPYHCGYPGFVISCTEKNQTILELPYSVKLSVDQINYKSREIVVHDPEFCLQRQLQNLTLSAYPFQLIPDSSNSLRVYSIHDFTFFSCSPNKEYRYPFMSIPCRFPHGTPVYAVSSNSYLDELDLSSCHKLYSLSLPYSMFNGEYNFYFTWSESICRNCEKTGKNCRLKSNSNSKRPETECIPIPVKGTILNSNLLFLCALL